MTWFTKIIKIWFNQFEPNSLYKWQKLVVDLVKLLTYIIGNVFAELSMQLALTHTVMNCHSIGLNYFICAAVSYINYFICAAVSYINSLLRY